MQNNIDKSLTNSQKPKKFNEDHPWLGKNVFEETVKLVFPKEGKIIEEWGGSLRCNTSDGRNVNIADELNKL